MARWSPSTCWSDFSSALPDGCVTPQPPLPCPCQLMTASNFTEEIKATTKGAFTSPIVLSACPVWWAPALAHSGLLHPPCAGPTSLTPWKTLSPFTSWLGHSHHYTNKVSLFMLRNPLDPNPSLLSLPRIRRGRPRMLSAPALLLFSCDAVSAGLRSSPCPSNLSSVSPGTSALPDLFQV